MCVGHCNKKEISYFVGIGISMHRENQGRLLEEGLIPVEFISYGVQDIKFTRVFSFILVKVNRKELVSLALHRYGSNCKEQSQLQRCHQVLETIQTSWKSMRNSQDPNPASYQASIQLQMSMSCQLNIFPLQEMSWRAKKMEVHAYVCDSTATCRRLSLSVALAFKVESTVTHTHNCVTSGHSTPPAKPEYFCFFVSSLRMYRCW